VSQVIHGLAFPRVADSPVTSFEPASRMDGLRPIASMSMIYLARPSRAAFDRIVTLAQLGKGYGNDRADSAKADVRDQHTQVRRGGSKRQGLMRIPAPDPLHIVTSELSRDAVGYSEHRYRCL